MRTCSLSMNRGLTFGSQRSTRYDNTDAGFVFFGFPLADFPSLQVIIHDVPGIPIERNVVKHHKLVAASTGKDHVSILVVVSKTHAKETSVTRQTRSELKWNMNEWINEWINEWKNEYMRIESEFHPTSKSRAYKLGGFFDASTHLYKRLSPSVDGRVRQNFLLPTSKYLW